MRLRKQLIGVAVTATTWLALSGMATAAFPDFTGCVAADPEVELCINVQNKSGNLNIKGFNVPLGESLEIRGKLNANGTAIPDFVPPAGTNGFFADPVAVPGGLLGIEWIPGTNVLAITELAGPASAIDVNIATNSITVPVKVRLVNILLGMNCHIGSDSSPVVLNLITGTTSPPAPNRPISGRRGRLTSFPTYVTFTDNINVDNAFAVPGASRCGLGLGLINALVNAKLRLPSAAGNNSIEVNNDVALGLP